MTPAEFKTKWAKVTAKESAAYQSHFDDLCRVLQLPPPLEADPKGESFCYQKRVVKDAELFTFDDAGRLAESAPDDHERGFADVWRRGCFAWEYKGRKKNLDDAYRQLLRYRESLLNPPLLVVCDFDRFIIRTNFNGTVQETHEFSNAELDRPNNLRLLRAVFTDPDYLKPQRTTAQVTEQLAERIAEVARSLQRRESPELADATTRAELNFAQRRNLRIARFLNRVVFCFFAQDTGLLPPRLFSDLAKVGLDDPRHFAEALGNLFAVMAKGGTFGTHKIRHFNGHLFAESTVFELTAEELRALAAAGEADWQAIQPSIMGTLFERALEPEHRAQLGAHYTGEADIKTLVEPVLMAPFRREWAALRGELAAALAAGRGNATHRDRLAAFGAKLAAVTVLDPACGSGNFLYVALQQLLDLEKEVLTVGTQLGFRLAPGVGVHQLRALELNPYAFELAQVSVQIGFLQWRRDNGFELDRSPVLQNLEGFHNEDALLVPHFRSKAKTLKEAQAGEHAGEGDALKFYTERRWPECDVIVGNPPFLGDKLMRGELGDYYVERLREIFGDRIPGQSDLCCYWFEKARQQIEDAKCKRAGLIATQGIRGGANREVLKRIKESGDLFFAESDREWILAGATVHVSMIGFDDGSEGERRLNGSRVTVIHANLSSQANSASAAVLAASQKLSFLGSCKGGPFDITEAEALDLLNSGGNPHGRPNSDIIRPVLNTEDLVQAASFRWIVDTGSLSLEAASLYQRPFEEVVVGRVKVRRDTNRDKWLRENWWRPQRMRPEMRESIAPLGRFLVTTTTSKHRIFRWLKPPALPDHQLVVFGQSDDWFFGLLTSRFHEVWSLAQGTQLREKESGFRYTPTTCFETFPLPEPTPAQTATIADAARELNTLRERWLNPPEWTQTRTLTFPGTAAGPWARHVDPATLDPATGVGTVRFPHLEPRDAASAALLARRTLTALYNERPAWLAHAHARLDAAVAAAYGWPADLPDDALLERLLTLNLARSAAEQAHPTAPKPRASREKSEGDLL